MSTFAIRCVTLKAGTGESGGVGKKLLTGESPELLTSSRLSVPFDPLHGMLTAPPSLKGQEPAYSS